MLQNGDVVEVIRGSKPVVPPDWRSLTVTGRARSAIRKHIRQTEREEFIRLGRAAVDQAFARVNRPRLGISLRQALDRFALENDDELCSAVGRGRITALEVVEAVYPGLKESEKAVAAARTRIGDGKAGRLYVRGGGLTPGSRSTPSWLRPFRGRTRIVR